jgi:hypothetical protein
MMIMNPVREWRRTLLVFIGTASLALLCGCQSAEEKAQAARMALAQANLDAPGIEYSSVQLRPDIAVAVQPFSVTDGNAKTREFEQAFFAAELVKALRSSPLKARVVYSPAQTAAVDYVIRGQAEPGVDNIFTTITLEDLAGRQVWSGPFADAEWYVIANRMIKELAGDAQPSTGVEAKRIAIYSDGEVTNPSDAVIAIGKVAAQREREKLLARYTELALGNANDYRKIYEDLRDQQRELAQEAEAENERQNQAMMSAFAAGLGGVGAAASGNQMGVANAQLQMAQSQAQFQASANRQNAIEMASQKLSESFGTAVTPTSISFMDKVYELSGSYDEQMGAFRKLVKQALVDAAAQSTTVSSTTAK